MKSGKLLFSIKIDFLIYKQRRVGRNIPKELIPKSNGETKYGPNSLSLILKKRLKLSNWFHLKRAEQSHKRISFIFDKEG